MQVGVTWRGIPGLVGLVAAGCAHSYVNPAYKADVDRVFAAHAGSNRQIAAPATIEPKPWKVGAWALYRRGGSSVQMGDEGYERISVVAEDPCGTWVLDESHGYYDQHSWMICLRPVAAGPTDASIDPVELVQVAIWESNGGSPWIVDFRNGQNAAYRTVVTAVASRLLPDPGLDRADLPREDVDVPAGHFAQAIRTTEMLDPKTQLRFARWSHPDVPFDATVKSSTSDGRERVLLAYGDDGATSVVPSLASALASAMQPKPTPSSFLGIGFGFGSLTGHAGEQSSRADKAGVVLGMRVASKLDLIGEVGVVDQADYSPDPLRSLSTFAVLLGVRWAPFRLAHLQPRFGFAGAAAFYAQADLGYTELWRRSMDDVDTLARGLVVGAAVGWIGCQGTVWAIGLELNDHIAFFNSSEGIRHSVGLMGVLQLYLPLFGM